MARFKVFPGRALGFALVLAAAVRLFVLARYYCISSDGVVYIKASAAFYNADIEAGFASMYPPGYPLLVAIAYPIVGDWEFTGQIVSLVLGVLLLLPLYGLFRKVFDERVALGAAVLAAISPYLVLYSAHVRSESLYLFLSASAIYLFCGPSRITVGAGFSPGGWSPAMRIWCDPKGWGFCF